MPDVKETLENGSFWVTWGQAGGLGKIAADAHAFFYGRVIYLKCALINTCNNLGEYG
jgi:hypothetical protein